MEGLRRYVRDKNEDMIRDLQEGTRQSGVLELEREFYEEERAKH